MPASQLTTGKENAGKVWDRGNKREINIWGRMESRNKETTIDHAMQAELKWCKDVFLTGKTTKKKPNNGEHDKWNRQGVK